MFALWVGGAFLITIKWEWVGGILVIAGWGYYFYACALTQRNIEKKEKEEITIYRIPKNELIQEGYKYYCLGCGAAYKELSFDSLEGRLNTKMCSCGTNSFATLDGDKHIREDGEQIDDKARESQA
jgi:hypothetical protein